MWAVRATSAMAMFLVLGVGYAGATGNLGNMFDEDRPPDMDVSQTPGELQPATGAERAGVFAIHALGQAGLRHQNGTYVDYRETTEEGEASWTSQFGPPSDCSHEVVTLGEGDRAEQVDETLIEGWHCEDLSDQLVEVGVELSGGRYVVTSVEGPINDETRAAILSYSESDEPYEPSFEVTDFEIMEDSDSLVAHGSVLWTGRGRDTVFQECSLAFRDESGAEVARNDFHPGFSLSQHSGPSDRAWEKDQLKNGGVPADSQREGHFHEFAPERSTDATSATLECRPIDLEKEEAEQAEEETKLQARQEETCAQPGFTCTQLKGHATQIAVGEGSVWVAGFDVVRLDPETGEAIADIPVDGHIESLTIGEGAVWAVYAPESNEEAFVLKIDPDSNAIVGDPIPVKSSFVGDPLYGGSVGSLYAAAGEGAVWVTAPGAILQKIDPATGEVQTHSLGPQVNDDPGYGAPYVLAGDGWVWIQQGAKLFRVDPETIELVGDPIDVGLNVRGVAIGEGHVWLVQQTPIGDNIMTSVDTSSREAGAPIQLGNAIPERVVVDPGIVWVLAHDGKGKEAWLFAIDPASQQLRGEPIPIATHGFAALGAGEGAAWVSGEGVLYRYEP